VAKLVGSAEQTIVTEGPPEAPWYGPWNLILSVMTLNMATVAVTPQMAFRTRTSAIKNHTSTRATDFGLAYLRDVIMFGETHHLSDPMMAVEVKPFTSELQKEWQRDSRVKQARHDLEAQLNHFFASVDDEDEGGQPPAMIGIAVAGRYWSWNRYSRIPATPAKQSKQSITKYMEKHPILFTTLLNQTKIYEVGTDESENQLESIHNLIVKGAPDQV
jgi:hypothetical protein